MSQKQNTIHDEPSNFEILGAINTFATAMEQRLQKIENRLNRAEAIMVTKDYLDNKLADFAGEMWTMIRK